MKVLLWLTGLASAVVLALFVMEIRDELEEERWWRSREKW